MAWTPPRTWSPGETVTASLLNTHIRDNENYLKATVAANETITRGGIMVNPNGILAAINIICWYAPYACTVKKVRGYRVGGTGATINARKNGSLTHLASALSLTSSDTWMDGGAVQNTSYAAGDKMEVMIVSEAGSPTQLGVQVELSVP